MSDAQVIPAGEVLPPLERPKRVGRIDARERGNTDRATTRNAQSFGGRVRRRFALLNAVADCALPRMTGRADIAAWLVLFRHASADGTVTASVADLARRADCSESAMRRALKRMQSAGLLERRKRGTLAGGPSVWRLLSPEPRPP